MKPPQRPFALAEVGDEDKINTDVPPNVSQRFLIAFCDTNDSAGEVGLALRPKATTTRRDILPPGIYQLTLALTADNTDATFWQTELTFVEGFTGEADIRNHIRLTPPTRVGSPNSSA
jgi:hypothetical protein